MPSALLERIEPGVGRLALQLSSGRRDRLMRVTRRNDMARASAHPDHECISSEDVQGTEVYGPAGKHIGEIDHLIIDKMSGRVAYAVMSFGGFMGLAQPNRLGNPPDSNPAGHALDISPQKEEPRRSGFTSTALRK
jgi:hypothetical protein